MTVDLRGFGGGLKLGYAEAVTFRSWSLRGDEVNGFVLTATVEKAVPAYCSSELTAWVPLQHSAWEWDGVTIDPVDPTTSLTVTVFGMPHIVRH